jgi:dipeptidyl aminopeptidase/acylaminoacyl peptidase
MTDSEAAPRIPYGAWPSPISAADVAKGQIHISYPLVTDKDVWWQEGRPSEGGRVTVVCCDAAGHQRDVLPAPWNARSRVHEYGGRSYLPVPAPGDGRGGPAELAVVFANYADQRLYLATEVGAGQRKPAGRQAARAAGQQAGPAPRPLTPPLPGDVAELAEPAEAADPVAEERAALRFADFILSPDGTEIWCVQERHQGGKIARAIVAVPLDGSAADDPGAIRELVTGPDFFAFPTLSPDGSRLAWVCWNHPRMPWDGTELRVGPISDGTVGRGRLVKGGMRESVLAPVWRNDTSLYVVSDWPGWWNLYQVGLVGEPAQALYPAEEEFAEPLWQLGGRPYAMLGDGRLAVLHGQGSMRLGVLDPETGEIADIDLPFPQFVSGLSADGNTIVGVAGGPLVPLSVVRVDAASGEHEVLRRESEDVPDPEYLPVPSQVRLEGVYGRNVHALVYPPAHPDAVALDGELPPYVAWAHGGPTSHVTGLLDLEKAFFTSRGIGVIDVNYGGSTGYGRSYRERLRMNWGVVDVEDVASAALALAGQDQADAARLAIRGGSAGGWTALAAVTTYTVKHDPVFSAATSYFGVADLREFASQTHDFESHYLDGLIGPLPGFEYVYAERSPSGHVTDKTCPVLLLQGLDDPIVPPAQSQSIADDLAKHGTRHALLTFKGESHGFRRAETIIAALEAELSFYGQVLGFSPPGIPQLPLGNGSAGGGEGPGRDRERGSATAGKAARGRPGAAGQPGAAGKPGNRAPGGATSGGGTPGDGTTGDGTTGDRTTGGGAGAAKDEVGTGKLRAAGSPRAASS